MPDMSEAELQSAVIELAHLCRWRVAHFRPAPNGRGGWATPVSADGAGFPDIVMARNGEVIVAELKTKAGKLSPEQEAWMASLSSRDFADRRLRVYVWRPQSWINGEIELALH